MKNFKTLILIAAILLQGCATTTFYQLYKTESDNVKVEENELLFENEEIKVVFNLWDNYGNSGFLIFNKTDSNIYIDLKKSHLIINGIAKTYFQNRTFTESSSSSLSLGNSYTSSYLNKNSSAYGSAYYSDNFGTANYQSVTKGILTTSSSKSKTTFAKGFSVSYIEKDIVIIPSNSAKVFNGFNLNNSLFRDCDLFRYPSIKSIKTKNFDLENTPLKFENIISYGYELNKIKEIKCNFWVSEITNYPSTEFMERKYPEYCGDKSQNSKNYFIYSNPNNFYIKYSKGSSIGFKH